MFKSTLLILVAAASAAVAEPVQFLWFDYTGRDEVFAERLPAGHYWNPILAGYYPDPSICRVGEDYYLINSSFGHFPGIPIFHSTDLVNWTQIGHAIDRPSQINYDGVGVSRGIFAPAISYHDGVFYIVCTMVDAGGNFVITATDPAGPWSDPVWLEFDGIDPSLFFDDSTGRAWLVNNGEPPDRKPLYNGHRAIWLQEWDIASRRPIGERKIIINGGVDLAKEPSWIEGPHLFKRGDWYYLNCAEGGTSEQHSQVIFRSRQLEGPFEPWRERPTLTQRDLDPARPHPVTCTGHADLTIGPDGHWWAVFLGCTPYADGHFNTGRQTFMLPVTWADEWPSILAPGEAVPFVVAGPNGGGLIAGAERPLTGNFTTRDKFDGAKLGWAWLTLRAPHETWWRTGDGVWLEPRAETLRDKGTPSFLGRRLQHNRFTVATAVRVPTERGVTAGLVAFHNETHHFGFGVSSRAESDQWWIVVETENGAPDAVRDQAVPIAVKPGEVVRLRLTGDDTRYTFEYAVGENGEDWKMIGGDFDARTLSVATSFDFVGVLVGVMARKD